MPEWRKSGVKADTALRKTQAMLVNYIRLLLTDAMNVGKGKLANKYFMLAEEAWCEVEEWFWFLIHNVIFIATINLGRGWGGGGGGVHILSNIHSSACIWFIRAKKISFRFIFIILCTTKIKTKQKMKISNYFNKFLYFHVLQISRVIFHDRKDDV